MVYIGINISDSSVYTKIKLDIDLVIDLNRNWMVMVIAYEIAVRL